MVFLDSKKTSDVEIYDYNLELESGHHIDYVAPDSCSLSTRIVNSNLEGTMRLRKSSTYDPNDQSDDWDGVRCLSQAIDTALNYESESLLTGKSVLEMGFCTGILSVLALANKAAHVTLFTSEVDMWINCIKPTLMKNMVENTQRKVIVGSLSDLHKAANALQFDVILASEYLNTDKHSYEQLHDIIDYLLAPDGLCIFSSRMSYFHHDNSLPEFIDLVKIKGKFIVHERWSSSDFLQRKVIQLIRAIR